MTVLIEGDLKITIPDGITARKLDDDSTHGLSHCMKAVDFVIEFNDCVLFVELKDPDHPAAQLVNRQKFLGEFLGGKIDADLTGKCRDSFLYEWGYERVDKPIHYLVLIAASTIGSAELLVRTDALKRRLPLLGPSGDSWSRPFVAGCLVMNLVEWNKRLPQFPVSRVSE